MATRPKAASLRQALCPGPRPSGASNYILAALASEVGPYLYLPGRLEGKKDPVVESVAQGQGQRVASLDALRPTSSAFTGNAEPRFARRALGTQQLWALFFPGHY